MTRSEAIAEVISNARALCIDYCPSHNGWEDSPCQSDAKDTLRALGVTDDEL